MIRRQTWRYWLGGLIIALWGLQIIWLAWHFSPEAGDLVQRAAHGDLGGAIRQEEPLFRWAAELKKIIPEHATYVFLDDYAAGKAIQVRYFLAPRRQILLAPNLPASFLFYELHQNQASFLIIRQSDKPLGPGAQAALASPAFQRLNLPGPGLALRVDGRLLSWGFYD